jgi:hypothetical protein
MMITRLFRQHSEWSPEHEVSEHMKGVEHPGHADWHHPSTNGWELYASVLSDPAVLLGRGVLLGEFREASRYRISLFFPSKDAFKCRELSSSNGILRLTDVQRLKNLASVSTRIVLLHHGFILQRQKVCC